MNLTDWKILEEISLIIIVIKLVIMQINVVNHQVNLNIILIFITRIIIDRDILGSFTLGEKQ